MLAGKSTKHYTASGYIVISSYAMVLDSWSHHGVGIVGIVFLAERRWGHFVCVTPGYTL